MSAPASVGAGSDPLSPWAPMKALSSLVEAAVLHKRPGLRHDLEVALRKHKPQFIGLLKNPVRQGHSLPRISFLFPPPASFPLQPRSAGDADLVRKAQTEGIRFLSDGSAAAAAASAAAGASQGGDDSYGVQRLPPQVVEEALIIAEMFNLNEIVSLQLLLKGWFF